MRGSASTWGLGAVLSLLALPGTPAAALPGAGDRAPLHDKLHFEHLTNRDGLSQMSVNAVLQDRQGFLWIGTEDGLNRYDGYEFRIFKPQDDDSSVASGWILALLEDRSGALWIGTRKGLDRLDPRTGRFTHYRHHPDDPGSLSSDIVLALHEDRSGALWVGTEGGLDRLDAEGRFTSYRHDPDDRHSLNRDAVLCIAEDDSGNLWIGTREDGLDRLDPARKRFTHYHHDPDDPNSLSHNEVDAIHVDRSGRLWIATRGGGLNRFDPSEERFQRYRHDPEDRGSLSHDVTRAVHEDRSGTLWVATLGGGLNRFDAATESFHRYQRDLDDPHSLSHDMLLSIYEDRSGALWIGTLGGGLNRLDPTKERFTHYRHHPGDPHSLSHDIVLAILEDRLGRLWVGTVGGGLNRLDPTTGRFTHYRHDPDDPGSLGQVGVWALVEDRSGVLWVGGLGGGLSRFDPSSERFVRYRHDPGDPRSLGHDDVRAMTEDRSSGNLWIGTRGGLNRLGPARQHFVRYLHDPADSRSLSHNEVRSLTVDRSGRLWIGTVNGLNRLDPAQQGLPPEEDTRGFIRYRNDPQDPLSLSHNFVWSVYEDGSGILWIGTAGGGLNRLDPGQTGFRRYTREDGLVNDVVYGVLEDDLGRLWISTNDGIARFDPETGKWTSYDVGDGLQDQEFNVGAFHQGADGTMYFGGIGGFNAFQPERFQEASSPPPIAVTSFKVLEDDFGQPASYLSDVELTHRQNFFSFTFAALSFSGSEKNRYAYRLENLDEDWIDAGQRRYASYTSVPPGRYVFRLRGANSDGVWNDDGAAIKIVVRPPWWKTWWAWALYLAGLSALVTAYVAAQRKKLERERAIAVSERTIRRSVQEIAALKDELLADQQRRLGERQAQVEERGRLIAELEAKNVELKRLNYTISHDLKNPLVTIKGFLAMAHKAAGAGDLERLEQDLRRVGIAADQMRELLEEQLTLSRHGRTAEPEEVALDEVVRDALELVGGRIAACQAEVEVATGLPAVVGDRTSLLSLFQNLLDNALKFIGDQPSPRVEVGSRTGGDETVLFVRDNGIGIEVSDHGKIFGLFDRLDPDVEGTGIGLALAERTVELHGGRIWVESQGRGHGSTFCFTLPRSRSVPA